MIRLIKLELLYLAGKTLGGFSLSLQNSPVLFPHSGYTQENLLTYFPSVGVSEREIDPLSKAPLLT